MLKSHFKKISI